ncbi:MAG TPA: threonine/serine exporter, partial [Firmicutes bacterium]|nr:threonine/serine exporter [Bacillota bacterium]
DINKQRPPNQILRSGLVGGAGWLVFLLAKDILGEISAMFLAATVAAVLSETFARRIKQPVVVLLIPGVIPLVPGGKAYLTMLSFLQDDYIQGLELLVSTMFLAGAVAAGIILASSAFRIFHRANSLGGRNT